MDMAMRQHPLVQGGGLRLLEKFLEHARGVSPESIQLMHNELGIPVPEPPLAVRHFFANLLRGCLGLGCLSLDRRDACNFRSVSLYQPCG